MVGSMPNAFQRSFQSEMERAERDTAIRSLQWLTATTWGEQPIPSEEAIAAFVRAMRQNPRVVPSADPDDP